MKKLVLIALLISLFQVANAQDAEPGKKLILGGTMNFVSRSNNPPSDPLVPFIYLPIGGDTKSTFFSIKPYAGKEIKPGLAIGAQLSFMNGKVHLENAWDWLPPSGITREYKFNEVGFGVFTRHILNPERSLNFFLQPSFVYYIRNQKEYRDSNLVDDRKTTYFDLGVGMGVLYNINDKVGAIIKTGGLRYLNGETKVIEGDPDNAKSFSLFSAGVDLTSITFGVEMKI